MDRKRDTRESMYILPSGGRMRIRALWKHSKGKEDIFTNNGSGSEWIYIENLDKFQNWVENAFKRSINNVETFYYQIEGEEK